MSFDACRWLADLAPNSILDDKTFRILFILCDAHNPENGCFPSQDTIARRTGFSRKTVNLKLKWLETEGFLTRKRQCYLHKRGRASTYYILGFEDRLNPVDKYVDK